MWASVSTDNQIPILCSNIQEIGSFTLSDCRLHIIEAGVGVSAARISSMSKDLPILHICFHFSMVYQQKCCERIQGNLFVIAENEQREFMQIKKGPKSQSLYALVSLP